MITEMDVEKVGGIYFLTTRDQAIKLCTVTKLQAFSMLCLKSTINA